MTQLSGHRNLTPVARTPFLCLFFLPPTLQLQRPECSLAASCSAHLAGATVTSSSLLSTTPARGWHRCGKGSQTNLSSLMHGCEHQGCFFSLLVLKIHKELWAGHCDWTDKLKPYVPVVAHWRKTFTATRWCWYQSSLYLFWLHLWTWHIRIQKASEFHNGPQDFAAGLCWVNRDSWRR